MTEINKDVSIETVKEFWNANPLFSGEASAELATKEWFEAHEAVVERDCLPDVGQYSLFSKGLNQSAAILDVGCGPGYWVRWFLRQGFRKVSACDLTPKAVAVTSKSLELFQLNTSGVSVEGHAESLP
ncbi:MAG: class I SAM-dependent methyltransferase, partial [Halodesulfovibrio sp.]